MFHLAPEVCFGIGVAGNFAGHLEQAGESADFAAVGAAAGAPKGIFPFYAPGNEGFLGAFPLDSHEIILPKSAEPLNLQIEPEAGVCFHVDYADDGVMALRPFGILAFNDCSIRRPGASRISEKKNWGPASKGYADQLIPIDEIERDGATAALRLASFLRRDGELHEYGVDSPLPGYSYYGAQLIDWLIERLRQQRDAGPLEDVGALLASSGSPRILLVGIGATRYTEYGEQTFLEPGDESIVAIYDGATSSADELRDALNSGRELEQASILIQRVVGP